MAKQWALFNVDIRKNQRKVVYVAEIKFQKEVRLASHHDEFAKEMKQNIQKGIKSHFHF
jgi:hypothetical protein